MFAHLHYSHFTLCSYSEFSTTVRHELTPVFNPLMGKGTYSATLNNTKLVHWPLMGGLLHLV